MIDTKKGIENELQEKARLLTVETLSEYIIPAEINEKITQGIEYHNNGDRFFFLFLPSEPAKWVLRLSVLTAISILANVK